MDTPTRPKTGMTLLELLVVILVIVFLIGFAFPVVDRGPVKAQLVQAMNNAKQIHLATMSMVTDGESDKNLELDWPGELKAKGYIKNVPDFVNLLVRKDYLKPGDLKVFAATGIPAYQFDQQKQYDPQKPFDPPFKEENNAFKIFLVKKDDDSSAIFLTTKNYTYNKPLDPKAKPFGDKGFVIIRKGGDASIFKKQQAQNYEIIGKLPGGGTVESAENCLNPGP